MFALPPLLTAIITALLMLLGIVAPSAPIAGGGAEAYGHVVTYDTQPGMHRTGTPGGAATADWIADELSSYGLDPAFESFTFPKFDLKSASLDVGGFQPDVFPMYYSGITGPAGLTAPIVSVGLGTALDYALTDVAGKIALIGAPAVQNALAPTLEMAVSGARDHGAVAVIASVWGVANEPIAHNADANAGMCDFPILAVGKLDGGRLHELSGSTAHLVLDAAYEDGTGGGPIGETSNVVAKIQGASDDAIIIGTPYTGWFNSAVERGTGVGTFLALARHFAERSQAKQLPLTLVFVATAGHEVGFLGLPKFMAAHPDLVQRAAAYLHLGAGLAAKGYKEVAGQIIETGLPDEFRFLWMSENLLLSPLALHAFVTNAPGPTAPIPAGAYDPGEQSFMYRQSVPLIAVGGGYLWIHTRNDHADGTSAALLEPIVRGFQQVIDELLAFDTATLREANAVANALAGSAAEPGSEALLHC